MSAVSRQQLLWLVTGNALLFPLYFYTISLGAYLSFGMRSIVAAVAVFVIADCVAAWRISVRFGAVVQSLVLVPVTWIIFSSMQEPGPPKVSAKEIIHVLPYLLYFVPLAAMISAVLIMSLRALMNQAHRSRKSQNL